MICSSNRFIFLTLLIVSTVAVNNVLGNTDEKIIAEKEKVTPIAASDAAPEPPKPTITDTSDNKNENEKTVVKSSESSPQSPPPGVEVVLSEPSPLTEFDNSTSGDDTPKKKRCVNCGEYRTVVYTYPDGRREERVISRSRSLQIAQSGCQPGVCGTGASCREVGGRPVCSCPPGFEGSPLSHCGRPECLDHIECPLSLACKNNRCVNPCNGACGAGALCEPRNHVAVCSCPRNYEGDPYHSCRPSDPEAACRPSPCGANTKCESINGVPTCSCLSGYEGNPISGCRHECDYDGDCSSQEMCKDFKCVKACNQCGTLANCVSVANHRAVCECPKGYIGSPYTECRPECYGDVDCPSGRPACFYGICKNTCEGACGVGADCNLRGLTPVCSCPRDMTGDPFIRCRPFTKEDLCEPNPCGQNAYCVPGHDNTGKERPVCNCSPGYTGNPLTHCVRGECQSNEECADSQACINYQCVNPCIGKCGGGASCEPKAHLAVCKCPTGTQGDALVSCRQSRKIPVAKYH